MLFSQTVVLTPQTLYSGEVSRTYSLLSKAFTCIEKAISGIQCYQADCYT